SPGGRRGAGPGGAAGSGGAGAAGVYGPGGGSGAGGAAADGEREAGPAGLAGPGVRGGWRPGPGDCPGAGGVRGVVGPPPRGPGARGRGGGAAPRPPLVRMPRPERLPLSFAQQRLWFLEQFHGPGTAYNLPFAWRLHGPLDAAALVAAVGDVVARHESLRTVFAVADGQPYQHVIEAGRAVVPVTVTAAGRDEVAALVAAAAAHEFDLASELPVRAWLFTLAEQDQGQDQGQGQ